MLFQSGLFFVYVLPKILYSFELPFDSYRTICTSESESKNYTGPAHTVKDCHHKIRIALHIKNDGKSPEEVKFILIKEVLDVQTGVTSRLLNPLAIRFRQEQVLLGYPLKYLTAVNARASEHVINYENKSNFTGCDDESPVNPTCGVQHEKGMPVKYSEGFCCFCPATPTTGKQARGGQDCSVAKSPSPSIDIVAYKASAHCLKKSNIWYTVNAVEEPTVLHQVYLQVYLKRHLINGSVVWVALTGEEDFALGTQNPYQFDENMTIIISHLTEKPVESAITVPFQENRLLVPQPILGTDVADLPAAVKNGASDYLLISKNVIQSEGDECDKAGVSYDAFAKQEDRCNVPRNSCLKNQPLDFWDSDIEKEKGGKKGSYVLRSFGMPYKEPIIVDKQTRDHWLAMEYYKTHRTAVRIEVKANNIIALKVGKHAMIIYTITEAANKYIAFHVRVQNAGLVSSEFTLQALRCGYHVLETATVTKVIPPQLTVDFLLSTKPGDIQLNEEIVCTVEVRSALYGVVAQRVVLIKPKTRCICNLHCLCKCLGSSLKCEPMTADDYHLAGFRGSLPMLTAKPPHKSYFAQYPFATFVMFVMIFLLLGFIKAGLGLCGVDVIAEFGLYSSLYKPKKLDRYPDIDLEDLEVMYDNDGYPLHPHTQERYKTFSPVYLFALNLCFCCYWPVYNAFEQMGKKHQKGEYENVLSDDAVADVPDNVQTEAPASVEVDAVHSNVSAEKSKSETSRASKEEVPIEMPPEPDANYLRGSKPAIVHPEK